jgi:hypothetical protein
VLRLYLLLCFGDLLLLQHAGTNTEFPWSRLIPISVALVPPKFGFALKQIHLGLGRDFVLRIVHGHIRRWLASRTRRLEITAIATFQNIDLRVIYFGINVIVGGTILASQVFRAVRD